MLSKPYRLRKRAEFKQGFAKGRVARGRWTVVYSFIAESSDKRVGMVVSGKVGPAVVRNRVKRRLREIMRPHLPCLKEGARVILVARVRAREAQYQQIAAEVDKLLRETKALQSAA